MSKMSLESSKSSHFSTSDQRIDLVGALIGVDGLDITQVFHSLIFNLNSVSTHALACKLTSLSGHKSSFRFGHGNAADSHAALVVKLRDADS